MLSKESQGLSNEEALQKAVARYRAAIEDGSVVSGPCRLWEYSPIDLGSPGDPFIESSQATQ